MYKYFSIFILLFAISCSQNASETANSSETTATTSVGKAKATVQDIDQEAFKLENKKPGVFVLDVRTPQEIAGGKIRGAIEVDFKAAGFKDKLDKLPRDKKYMIYCRSGNRSGKTGQMMVDMGFQNVYNLVGGYDAWTEE